VRRRDLLGLLGGAVVAWPVGARAQQPMPVIGYLSVRSPETDDYRLAGFRQGLNETGYVEARNVAIEYRYAQGRQERLADLAVDLVRHQVSVIAAVAGTPAAFAAKAASPTIPIVFNLGIDPVHYGLVASLSRPGGNLTGVTTFTAELGAKLLQLLNELVPTAAAIAALVNPTNPYTVAETKSLQDGARSLGLELHILPATTASEIDAAFAALVELRAGALVVGADPFLTARKDQIVALAARHTVPAIYNYREEASAGGLMSYGVDLREESRQIGVLTGKILNGAKPADLPVQRAVKLELVINLKTAKALGLTIPQTLLGRADEVIE
jgi:putative ABC transport system substrate-binding protein